MKGYVRLKDPDEEVFLVEGDGHVVLHALLPAVALGRGRKGQGQGPQEGGRTEGNGHGAKERRMPEAAAPAPRTAGNDAEGVHRAADGRHPDDLSRPRAWQ